MSIALHHHECLRHKSDGQILFYFFFFFFFFWCSFNVHHPPKVLHTCTPLTQIGHPSCEGGGGGKRGGVRLDTMWPRDPPLFALLRLQVAGTVLQFVVCCYGFSGPCLGRGERVGAGTPGGMAKRVRACKATGSWRLKQPCLLLLFVLKDKMRRTNKYQTNKSGGCIWTPSPPPPPSQPSAAVHATTTCLPGLSFVLVFSVIAAFAKKFK